MVLSVEDNDSDFLFLKMALDRCPGPLEIQRLTNGEDALSCVQTWQKAPAEPKPALVILDLSLPRANGLEVLAALKSHYATRSIPVILFSSSLNPIARQKATALGVSGCVMKSLDFYQMVDSLVEACSKFLSKPQSPTVETKPQPLCFHPPLQSGFEA